MRHPFGHFSGGVADVDLAASDFEGAAVERNLLGEAGNIDLLVTPDPLLRRDLYFEAVFDYEQVLVVGRQHALATAPFANPEHLMSEVLITYPVSTDRLDIYNHFLAPAGVTPRRHKTVETTDIMLQMVASNQGIAATTRWLVAEYARGMDVVAARLGWRGLAKKFSWVFERAI